MSAKGGASSGYNYFGSIAGLVAACRVDALIGLSVDGKLVWPTHSVWAAGIAYAVNWIVSHKGLLWKCTGLHTASTANQPGVGADWTRFKIRRVDVSNPYNFDVVGYGTAYFYWGTSSQTLSDGVLDSSLHPPYRDQSFVVLKNFLFGQGRTSAPNIEVLVEREPIQTLITSQANVDGQANPICAWLDLLGNQLVGLGLPDSKFSAGTLGVLSTKFASAAARYYISPFLNRAIQARQFTADLSGYYDGWFRHGSDGKIEAGWFEHQPASAPTFSAATTIDVHDLLEEPSIDGDSNGWDSTVNELFVKFADQTRSFKDGSEKAFHQANRDVVGEARPTTLTRQWITRREQAKLFGAEAIKVLAQPKQSGTLSVRAEKATSIRSGDWFLFTWDPHGTSVVMRCMEKIMEAPPSGRVKIRFETERALSNAGYAATPSSPDAQAWPEPELLAFMEFWQPPPALAGDDDSTLGILVARANAISAGLNLWMRLKDATEFQLIGATREWACFGNLTQAYDQIGSIEVTTFARTSNVATITTAAAHGLVTGKQFYARNIPGTTEGTLYTITGAPTSTTLTFANTGADTGATALTAALITVMHRTAAVTTWARTSNVATITTAAAHGFSTGESFVSLNLPGLANGVITVIASTPTSTTFTYSNPGSNASPQAVADGYATALTGGTSMAGAEDVSNQLRITLASGTVQRDMDDRFAGVRSDDEIADATFLVIIFNTTGPRRAEVCALRAAALVSGSTYALQVSRNRYGSFTSAFASGDRCYIVSRANMPYFSHGSVAEAIEAGSGVALLRAAAFNGGATGEPADVPVTTATRARSSNVATITTGAAHRLSTGDQIVILGMGGTGYNTTTPVEVTVTNATTFTYPNTGSNEGSTADTGGTIDRALSIVDIYAPVIDFISIQRNTVEYNTGWSPSNSATTDVFRIGVRGTDRNEDITLVELVRDDGAGTVVTIWSYPLPSWPKVTVQDSFTLPVGTWTLRARCQDVTGRLTEKDLEPVGGGTPFTITVV